MSDGDIDPLPLSDGTEALIEAFLKQHGPQRNVRPPAPSTSVLVRYLCNALPATEARQVEQALTASSETRRAVREVRLLLDRLQSLSWLEMAVIEQNISASSRSQWSLSSNQTAAIRGESSREAETAQAWLSLASQPLQAFAAEEIAPSAPGTDSWAEIRRRARGGRAQAQALWITLLAFGAQVQTQLRRPLPALARDSSATLSVYGPWAGECRLQETRIDAAGTLHVSATFVGFADTPATDFSGWTAYLALPAGGEIFLCASSTLTGEQVSWTVSEIGVGIGPQASAFPARGLVVLLGPPERFTLPVPSLRRFSQSLLAEGFLIASAEPPTENEEVVGLLAANILTIQGRESSLPPALLEVVGPPPHAVNGRLQIAVRLPAITRSAYAEGYRLLLDIAVAPQEWQHLDSWPIDDWGEAARTLSISCPGRTDGALASLTLLRARLAPSEAGSPNVS